MASERELRPWTMMFADDIVICSESKEHGEDKPENWIYALEKRRMKVNRRKTEYMSVSVCVNERHIENARRRGGESG